MTGKDLLIGFGDISPKYYKELETASIAATTKHNSVRRPLLIAAVISLLLLLVGCAVVYVLRLQDMSIGKETYTQSFDESGKAIEPMEKTRDIVTFYGHSGDPIQLAMREWTEFMQAYDPDGKLADNSPDHPEIPDYLEWTYGCYTLEMANKVTEIAANHNLKLLEEWIPFQRWQSDVIVEEAGIGNLVLPNSGASVKNMAGMFYPPYNFSMEFTLKTDTVIGLSSRMDYARKDYFPAPIFGSIDLSQFDQWDHTAPDGTKLLMALGSKGQAYVIAERPEAMVVLTFYGNFSGSAYPGSDEILTKEQLEKIADVFDYSVQPSSIDRAAVQGRLDAAEAAYQAEHSLVEPTFSSFNEYLKENYHRPVEELQYTFYDLTGDGEKEMLIGKDGWFDVWLTVRNGEVQSRILGNTYLCEGGILEDYGKDGLYEHHNYLISSKDGVIDDLELDWDQIIDVRRTKNEWFDCTVTEPYQPDRRITEAEAQTVISKYKHVALEWKPLMDYSLADGYTLRDYIEEKDVRVSDTELHGIYRDYLKEREEKGAMYYTHYRILDINGDGVDDLLLKGEDDSFTGSTDYYWVALTYRYGRMMDLLFHDFYLCEDGVMERIERWSFEPGEEITVHHFQRLDEFNQEEIEFVAYNKATASWQTDWLGENTITEAEANAIFAKYPRIDQGMLPIAELLK